MFNGDSKSQKSQVVYSTRSKKPQVSAQTTIPSKKQADVTLSVLDKPDFKPKLLRRDREGHYIPIKGKSIKGY